MPPLRRRLEDIPLLVEHLLRGRKAISDDALEKLSGYRFPGNVRELENIVEAAVCLSVGDCIEPDHVALPQEAVGAPWRLDRSSSLSRCVPPE